MTLRLNWLRSQLSHKYISTGRTGGFRLWTAQSALREWLKENNP